MFQTMVDFVKVNKNSEKLLGFKELTNSCRIMYSQSLEVGYYKNSIVKLHLLCKLLKEYQQTLWQEIFFSDTRVVEEAISRNKNSERVAYQRNLQIQEAMEYEKFLHFILFSTSMEELNQVNKNIEFNCLPSQ